MKAFFFRHDIDTGRVQTLPVLDSVKNSLAPDISFDDARLGGVKYSKFFIFPEQTVPTLRIVAFEPSRMLLHAGTEVDTDPSAYTAWKGSGVLSGPVYHGEVTTISVRAQHAGIGFNPLDLIRISDNVAVEEFVRIKSVVWNGYDATITLLSGFILTYDYATGAAVCACVERGIVGKNAVWVKDIIPAFTGFKRNDTDILRVLF